MRKMPVVCQPLPAPLVLEMAPTACVRWLEARLLTSLEGHGSIARLPVPHSHITSAVEVKILIAGLNGGNHGRA
jgi:hypothetical protein